MKRALGLFGWQEEVKISEHLDILTSLIQEGHKTFNKIGFRNPGDDKYKHRSTRKPETVLRKIREIGSFSDVYFYEIHGDDLRVFDGSLVYTANRKEFVTCTDAQHFTPVNMLKNVELFCKIHTPRYGFSVDCETARFADAAASGVTITSMPPPIKKLSWRWQGMQSREHHLHGYLLDVFQFNVLSPLHLNFPVSGTSFDRWVAKSDGRGELIKIKPDVHVWLVPPSARARIRRELIENEMMSEDE